MDPSLHISQVIPSELHVRQLEMSQIDELLGTCEEELWLEVEAEIWLEAEPEVEVEFESEVETEFEPEIESECESEVATEFEPEVEPEIESEVKAEVEPEIESEDESEDESEGESEVGPEVKAEGEMEEDGMEAELLETIGVIELSDARLSISVFCSGASIPRGFPFSSKSLKESKEVPVLPKIVTLSSSEDPKFLLPCAFPRASGPTPPVVILSPVMLLSELRFSSSEKKFPSSSFEIVLPGSLDVILLWAKIEIAKHAERYIIIRFFIFPKSIYLFCFF